MGETVKLWRPTGQVELDLVRQSGWKKWPPRKPDQPIFYPVLNRQYATRITREWNVPQLGIGYVTAFDVQRSYLDRYQTHVVGGKEHLEYWIPADELEEFNAHIVGSIREEVAYRGPVPQGEFEQAERALGQPFPPAWRNYLVQPSWFWRGWISGGYFSFYLPGDTVEITAAWDTSNALHPGNFLIGDNGSSELLAVDMRTPSHRVLAVNNTSAGWHEAIVQSDSLEEFLTMVEEGTFVLRLQ